MKRSTLVIPALALLLGGHAFADDKSHGHMQDGTMMKDHGAMSDGKPMTMPQQAADMTDGEITRISKGSKKLTIKHGEIKNLDMPPMTMVFNVSDDNMLEMVKKGDKIRFRAEDVNGQMVVTEIAPQ